jgi:hypothetical protein
MKFRAALAVLAVAVGVTAFSAVTSESTAVAATTCYGGAITIPYDGIGLYPEGSGSYTTTSRCNDINMKVARGSVSACVIFVDHTRDCNYWTTVRTSWVTIATNVRNGTHFQVGIQGHDDQLDMNMYLAY